MKSSLKSGLMKYGNSLAASLFVVLFFAMSISCSESKDSNSGKPGPQKPGGGATAPNPFPVDSPYLKPNEGAFSVEKMLVNVGVNVVYPATKAMALEAQLLARDVAGACASAGPAKLSSPEWKKAQDQWKEAMRAFHYMEAMSVGPLRKDNFESHLYSWPYISLCGIDQMVVTGSQGGTLDLENAGINVKGLGALEFLLFDATTSQNCNRRAYPDVAKWAEKPLAEKVVDRCVVANLLTKDLEENAKHLEAQWNPDGINYSKLLIDGSTYKDTKAAVTDLLHGLYSIEVLKDRRLARPLGLSKECGSDEGKCPELAEHALSGFALEAMEAQVKGFHDAFYGSEDENIKAFGFDDYLESARHPEVASQMGGVLYDLSQNIELVKPAGTFQDQIQNMNVADCKATTLTDRRVELCAIYQDAREITTILKTQILAIFSLEAPPGYQGDND